MVGLEWSGATVVNQAELRALAEVRIQDAKALIDGVGPTWDITFQGMPSNFALKSCTLARMVYVQVGSTVTTLRRSMNVESTILSSW